MKIKKVFTYETSIKRWDLLERFAKRPLFKYKKSHFSIYYKFNKKNGKDFIKSFEFNLNRYSPRFLVECEDNKVTLIFKDDKFYMSLLWISTLLAPVAIIPAFYSGLQKGDIFNLKLGIGIILFFVFCHVLNYFLHKRVFYLADEFIKTYILK